MDLKKFKEDYDGYTFQQKKETVVTMLEWLLWKGENFDNIYSFITQNPGEVYENELDEVFQILLVGMYQDSQEKLKEAEQQLDGVKERMNELRKKEEEERKNENLDGFLDSALLNM